MKQFDSLDAFQRSSTDKGEYDAPRIAQVNNLVQTLQQILKSVGSCAVVRLAAMTNPALLVVACPKVGRV